MSKSKAKAKSAQSERPPVIEAIKGFDKNLKCRDFQFAIGETYTHAGAVKACASGFHACENPIDVFSYYEPGISRFAVVEMAGEFSREEDADSKVAAASITIKAELTIPEVIGRAFAWIVAHCSPADSSHTTGDSSASSATGYRSASSATGDRSASSATGDRSASSATGYRSASSATGDSSASSATGDRSASSATGDSSASSATGYRSASSATGVAAVAMNIGYEGKAKASEGAAIVLCAHNTDGTLRHIRASKIGDNGVKPDTWYALSQDGEFVEVK